MRDRLISIIIPIYNADRFIRKCLDSIIAQTHNNWEAILVDDGSLDNCGWICDEYARNEKRFKVIHQENGGVSVARQTGLNNTIGEYIIHCDPDDWIEPTMLEDMLECAIVNDADIVTCDFIKEYKDHKTYFPQDFQQNATAKQIQDLIIQGELFGSCCNKLIKKKCIEGIGFYPSNISYSEDTLFNIRILNQNLKVTHIAHAYYHYNMMNESSICSSPSKNSIMSRCIVISEIDKIIEEKERNNLYAMKKEVLESLFKMKYFKELKRTYPEIHNIIAKNKKKYSFFTPFGYFFAKALDGNPWLYHFMYKCNFITIKIIQRLRGKTI